MEGWTRLPVTVGSCTRPTCVFTTARSQPAFPVPLGGLGPGLSAFSRACRADAAALCPLRQAGREQRRGRGGVSLAAVGKGEGGSIWPVALLPRLVATFPARSPPLFHETSGPNPPLQEVGLNGLPRSLPALIFSGSMNGGSGGDLGVGPGRRQEGSSQRWADALALCRPAAAPLRGPASVAEALGSSVLSVVALEELSTPCWRPLGT